MPAAGRGGDAGAKRGQAKNRLRLVAVVFALGFASVGVRLADLAEDGLGQVGANPDSLLTAALGGAGALNTAFKRGDILDAGGRVLATDIPTVSAVVDPRRVNDPEAAARTFARALQGVDGDALAAAIAKKKAAGSGYHVVKRHLSPGEHGALLEQVPPGTRWEHEQRRVYPQRQLASHVLGYTNGFASDGAEGVLAGVEYHQHARLMPEDGGQPEAVRLSLDMTVQGLVRESAQRAVDRFEAKGACAMILDVRRRAFVSMVSLPDFDPNRWRDEPPLARKNRCTSDVYELGSMFKLLTAAMALDSGAVSMRERFDATEPFKIGRTRIKDYRGHERWLSLPEVLAFSSNIGTVRMSIEAGGPDRQRPFLEALGLFGPSSVEVPDTARPLLPLKWGPIESATVAYGHGLSVSPAQFVASMAALVDDGVYRPATLLEPAAGDDQAGESEARRVISPATVERLRWLMWLVAEHGSGERAKVDGYVIGGKTGTAEKPENGRYGDEVVASFVAAFPINDPRYLVMVSLDEPQPAEGTHGYRTAGWNAAPTVGDIIERVGPVLGVLPSSLADRRAMEAHLEVHEVVNGRTHKTEDGYSARGFD